MSDLNVNGSVRKNFHIILCCPIFYDKPLGRASTCDVGTDGVTVMATTLTLRHVDLADKQCTYNVTLRRVRVTIVAVKRK